MSSVGCTGPAARPQCRAARAPPAPTPGPSAQLQPEWFSATKASSTVEDGTLFFVSISLDEDALAHATRLQELLCNGHHPGVGRIQTVKGKESQEKVKEKQCKVKERQ